MLRIQPVPAAPRSLLKQPSPVLDEATLALIEYPSNSKRLLNRPTRVRAEAGKRTQAREDEELAINLFAQETAALLDAERDDDLLEQLLWEEEMAMYDHEVAVALAEDRAPPPMPAKGGARVKGGIYRGDHRLVARFGEGAETPVLRLETDEQTDAFEQALNIALESLRMEPEHDEDGHFKGSFSVGASTSRRRLEELRKELARLDVGPSTPPTPPAQSPPPIHSCTVCGDDIDGTVVRLDCGHTFDSGCMTEMFQRATVDESLFPPKCCKGAIDLAAVEPHLDRLLVDTFKKKSREFTTANRVYCHNPACATFLGPAAPEDSPETLRCPECSAGTCASCKEQTHPGVPCHFAAEDVVLDLGKAQGWQRCPSCRHLVELSVGCYHIVCRCSKQFCYLCAATWKECNCALFYVPPEEQQGEQ
ncbi:hypothetical protein BD414DRAFT_534494 [Trametes punicea]|nr:hypothetical protein BD414DRAFT_534494 [Trametes punicea]